MAERKQTKTIYIDRQGDLELHIDTDESESESESERIVLVVSSKAMSTACDPWKVMLGPNFLEGQPGHNKIIPLDDNPEALTILLRIAHLQFSKVPPTLEFHSLLEVAILTDKYQATHLVIPWIKKWIKGLKTLSKSTGFEEWLWIAWEYGRADIFQRMVDRLVVQSMTNEKKKCLNLIGDALEAYMPPDIIGTLSMEHDGLHKVNIAVMINLTEIGLSVESILKVRGATIGRLLDLVYRLVEQFLERDCFENHEGPFPPICKNQSTACQATSLGSLLLELRRIGLWPQRKSSEVFISVEQLAEHLRSIERFSNHEQPLHASDDHSSCDFTFELRKSVDDIVKAENIPTAILDSHHHHLKVQQEKCALER